MNDRKHVIYIGAMVMPDKNAGAQRVLSLSKSIIDIGYIPILIGLDYDISNSDDILSTKKTYNNIECYVIHYPSNKHEWIKRMTSIHEFIKVMKLYGIEKIHSIIAIDYEMIALYKLQQFCKKNNIFFIADNMEWYEKSNFPFPKNMVKNIDTYIRMNILYPRISNMICISRFLYNHYIRNYPDKNIVLIPVTVDKSDGKWKKLPNYIPNDVFTIIYAGDPGDYCIKERLDWLIQAVCMANETGNSCSLIIIGVDKIKFENQYTMLKELDGYRNIIFQGKVSHIDCLYEIRRADMFAIIRENRLVTIAGFPTKLAEGLACGTPVLTTPSSNISEFVINGELGFVTKGFDYEDIEQMLFLAIQLNKDKLMLMHQKCNEFDLLNYHNFNNELDGFFYKLKF